ncbi:hypothetical protein C2857_005717 [Epichloe festucae Fl1]|uniref:Uncharacterized protein n=1 Tax=Epichloe festucae (strain Fl1) TaxID=877507 RepID=A0A7S9KSZ5_EPIFF|nr:hypothetical protein C2857_005717 [Epichloe festucae Fl1]
MRPVCESRTVKGFSNGMSPVIASRSSTQNVGRGPREAQRRACKPSTELPFQHETAAQDVLKLASTSGRGCAGEHAVHFFKYAWQTESQAEDLVELRLKM